MSGPSAGPAAGAAVAGPGSRPSTACVVGAYAMASGDAGDVRHLLTLLTQVPGVTGFELPLGWLADVDAEPLLRDGPPTARHVLTLVGAGVAEAARDPHVGLASTDPAGRRRAIDLVRTAREEVTGLATRGIDVVAVEIHSWPSVDPIAADDGAAALTESLAEIAAWEWAGAALVVEHCDARSGGRPWQKGLLPLRAEIAAVEAIRATAPRTHVGMSVNWGRSAIEGRDPSLPAEHVRELHERGLLDGLVLSGAPGTDGAYGAAWSDVHPPMHDDEPQSVMTAAAVARTMAAGRPDLFLGVKVAARPPDLPPERRVDLVRNLLTAARAGTEQPGTE